MDSNSRPPIVVDPDQSRHVDHRKRLVVGLDDDAPAGDAVGDFALHRARLTRGSQPQGVAALMPLQTAALRSLLPLDQRPDWRPKARTSGRSIRRARHRPVPAADGRRVSVATWPVGGPLRRPQGLHQLPPGRIEAECGGQSGAGHGAEGGGAE